MVFFILWVFQPFGTYDFIISNKMMFLLGYGVIAVFTYMAFYALGYALFPKWVNAKRWNLLRELVSLLLALMLISLFSLFYHHWFTGHDKVTFIGYLYFLRYCLLVAVVPVAILYYQKWVQLKLNSIEENAIVETTTERGVGRYLFLKAGIKAKLLCRLIRMSWFG